MNKPTLLYDGDCAFCQYCVDYLKLRTLDAVKYQPYQQGTLGLTEADCQTAIGFVVTQHETYRGAAAAFKALSYGANNRGWWLYQNAPGFAWISEKIYCLVARHRTFCHTMAKIICGDPWQLGRLSMIVWGLVVLGLGLIFLL